VRITGGAGGGGGAATVSVAVADLDPLGPFAVSVYVVVLAGFTVRLPLAATVPIPVFRETSLALVVLQRSVADCPGLIDDGSTVKVAVGAPGTLSDGGVVVVPAFVTGGGGTGAFFPPQAVKATANNIKDAT
jgi:hypothetical protein